MKDELRTDGDPIAWRAWSTAQNQLWQLRQPAPPLEFPGEQGMFIDMYAQVREGEQVISPQFNRLLGRKTESCNFSALVMAQGAALLCS